jgi:L-iditol 2-dehydrogenase
MYYSNSDVRLAEMDVPRVGPGEMLLRIRASGVCGSDVMEWYRRPKAPLVLGHEIAGEVAEVGPGIGKFKRGDRVFATHHVPCNSCRYCLDGHHTVCDTLRTTHFDPGGFAEYVRLPAINVDRGTFLLPDEVSWEEGVFIEPLACVVRGLRQAGMRPGRNVLVVGSGLVGLLHIQLARALGAGRILATDRSRYRMEAAKRFGADAALHAEEDIPRRVRECNGGGLADLVITCAGAPSAIETAVRCVEPGGTILFFAPAGPDYRLPLPFNELWRNEITTTSAYGGAPGDLLQAIELLRAKRVRVEGMVTHRFGLAETQKGFELTARAEDSLKVVIDPQR